jgi:Uma2 family endonuclease
LIASEIEAFFRKGVQVIWVVDVEDGCTVHVYRSTSPEQVTVYRMGEIAEADPALPGWRMAVSELPYHQDVGILSTNALSNRDAEASDILVIPGKAEIVRGVVTHFSVAGGLAGWATDQIFSSLHDYARRTNSGIAVGDNKAFLVDLPGRKSFSPNAAFYTGKMSAGYYQGAPIFAVEVMDGLDYSNEGWRRIHSKRHDYFEAGTEVVWNVDVLVSEKVWAYRRANPDEPTRYGRGDVAEAEPAVPGWTMPVDELFL